MGDRTVYPNGICDYMTVRIVKLAESCIKKEDVNNTF